VNRELEGRVALVTGAGRNIGRAIALALAEAGARVVVNARTSRDEIDSVAKEIDGLAILADITDQKAVEAMVAQALGKFGRLDILVNNAAIRAVEPLEAIDAARWREVTGVILDGAWLCARACMASLGKSDAGPHARARERSRAKGRNGQLRCSGHDRDEEDFALGALRPRKRAWAARNARRSRGGGAFPGRPGRALHHRANPPCEWRGFRLTTPRAKSRARGRAGSSARSRTR
jgi:NAD(P)-dependent dehydrogenase (short-subunit alcohol dehydrogenase family)